MDFNLVVCGGTFDNFHKGHETFLNFALSLGGKLIVGLTGDEYIESSKLKTQNSKLIEDFEIRKKSLEEFLLRNKVQDRVSIVKINDLFGPTLNKNLLIDAIVVSEETKKSAEIINRKRKESGLKDLNILVVPRILAEDGKLISSARIRNGEINNEGRLYVRPEWLETDLILPENLREELHRPFAELLPDAGGLSINKNNLTVTVGDVTTKIFNEKALGQQLSIIDFKVERERRFSNIQELGFSKTKNIVMVDNPAGYITKDLFRKLAGIFKGNINKTILQVNGEEDLAVLPSILLAPLNTTIYYGQPPLRQGFEGQAGLVKIVVSRETKNKAYNLVSKLKQG